jgi:hypothetical protein
VDCGVVGLKIGAILVVGVAELMLVDACQWADNCNDQSQYAGRQASALTETGTEKVVFWGSWDIVYGGCENWIIYRAQVEAVGRQKHD